MDLSNVVKGLVYTPDPRLLVGIETGDDAGVLKLSDELALVQTVDYITPISNDPYEFGRVAAANSLSDVYAMGGTPISVLNVCAFPDKGIDPQDLTRILQGGLDTTTEAGAALAGGHTVKDRDLKYGLAVTGTVHPDKIWRNTGAQPGDRLILTKPIGTGTTITAHRKRKIDDADFEIATDVMKTLNAAACETAKGYRVHGATDITGFGLAGHVLGMAKGSGAEFLVHFDALPRFPWALDMIRRGMTTGATKPNAKHAGPYMEFRDSFTDNEQTLLFDPQTSGGLLLSVHPDDAEPLLAALREKGVSDAKIIGEVRTSESPRITIVR